MLRNTGFVLTKVKNCFQVASQPGRTKTLLRFGVILSAFPITPFFGCRMKKLLRLVSGLILLLAALIFGAPYYLGIKAEQSLTKQHEILANTSFLQIESRRYERGWFSSTETTVVRFKPTFLAQLQDKLPDNIKTILNQPITLESRVNHNLFADGIMPVRAVVDTQFTFQPESREILQRFFGSQPPASLRNVIRLDGSGRLSWQVPAFKYQELSGIAIDWQGLKGETDYAKYFTSYQTDLDNPGLTITLADKGSIAYQNLKLHTETRDGRHNLALGSSKLTLGQMQVEWKDNISYDIRLNDVLNMVSDLQIGSFINPYGQVPPAKISLTDLHIETRMDEDGQWVNTEGQFGFAKLNYGSDSYGPLAIIASAEHLDAESLAALKTRRDQLVTQRLNDGQMREALLATLRREASGLFTNDPVIRLKQFDLTTPQGMISSSGELKFNGLTAADLNDINSMLAKTDADFHIAIPQQLLEQLTASQAKNYISVDPSLPNADKEIQEAVRLWLDNILSGMARQGYLKIDGNQIVSTHIVIRDQAFSMNGKRIESQADQDLLPDSSLPADSSAPTASQPASAPAAASAASAPPKGASTP